MWEDRTSRINVTAQIVVDFVQMQLQNGTTNFTVLPLVEQTDIGLFTVGSLRHQCRHPVRSVSSFWHFQASAKKEPYSL